MYLRITPAGVHASLCAMAFGGTPSLPADALARYVLQMFGDDLKAWANPAQTVDDFVTFAKSLASLPDTRSQIGQA